MIYKIEKESHFKYNSQFGIFARGIAKALLGVCLNKWVVVVIRVMK